MNRIDLNSDVGESVSREGLSEEAAMFQSISSANIACGFHAGDRETMNITCEAAVLNSVVIGAHPSYKDRAGFGRRYIDVSQGELTDDIITQIGALQEVTRAVGSEVRYVKLHGALYNATVSDVLHASAVVDALVSLDGELPLVVPPASVMERLASEAGIKTFAEAFADRAYSPEGTLLSRRHEGAVITEVSQVVENVMRILDGEIIAADGSPLKISAETICLHSDTPGSRVLAQQVRAALDDAGVQVRSFLSE